MARWWTHFPFAVTRDVLNRGRERFNIYCTPCHGLSGEGGWHDRTAGFSAARPSLHTDQLRAAPAGHFFDVITNGFWRDVPVTATGSRRAIAGRSPLIFGRYNSAGGRRSAMFPAAERKILQGESR